MKLLAIDASRITLLINATRPTGQLYYPDVLNGMIERYRFVEFPKNITSDATVYEFKHGYFDGAAISSFEIYNDGIIASSSSNTRLVDRFIDDVLSWTKEKFDLVTYNSVKTNKNYDSNIVFSSDANLFGCFERLEAVSNEIQTVLASTNGMNDKFTPFGFSLAPVELRGSGLRPMPFRIERKIGTDSSLNHFVSSAPVPTDDHIRLVEMVERLF